MKNLNWEAWCFILVAYVISAVIGGGLLYLHPVLLIPTIIWIVGIFLSFGTYAFLMVRNGDGMPKYSPEYILPIFWVFFLICYVLMIILDHYNARRNPHRAHYNDDF